MGHVLGNARALAAEGLARVLPGQKARRLVQPHFIPLLEQAVVHLMGRGHPALEGFDHGPLGRSDPSQPGKPMPRRLCVHARMHALP